MTMWLCFFFFFQAEDGIRDLTVTGVQTCALPILHQAVHAVLESDEALANRVLEEEDAINELQIEIDDRVVQLLALHQLMATDLRFVLAISRINNRSEEHTSELQSQSNLVCRLLLE